MRCENRRKFETSCFAIDSRRTVIEYYHIKVALRQINNEIVKGSAKEMKDSLAHLLELEWDELEQLAPCVKKLHEVTERICKEIITSFV